MPAADVRELRSRGEESIRSFAGEKVEAPSSAEGPPMAWATAPRRQPSRAPGSPPSHARSRRTTCRRSIVPWWLSPRLWNRPRSRSSGLSMRPAPTGERWPMHRVAVARSAQRSVRLRQRCSRWTDTIPEAPNPNGWGTAPLQPEPNRSPRTTRARRREALSKPELELVQRSASLEQLIRAEAPSQRASTAALSPRPRPEARNGAKMPGANP